MNGINSLSLEQKIGQLFFLGIAGAELDEPTKDLLATVSPGGVCLFARNIREARQTRELLDNITAFLQTSPFLSIDQEGGLVDRLRRIMTPMPAASKLRTAEDAAELGRVINETLLLLGFNMDFAPVVDVVDETRANYANGLHSRAFGRDRKEVIELASAFIDPLQRNGLIGCLKHFPGLGASQIDSHENLPAVEITEDEFETVDLYPYRKMLSNVSGVMVAHACYPNLRLQETDKSGKLLPSSLSYNFVTTLLRKELGFNGLVITDDLEMGAIINNYGIGDACKMAINAGVDMLAICADDGRIREGADAVRSAVNSGEISEHRLDESLERIANVKRKLASPLAFDAERLDMLSEQIAALNEKLN